MALSQWGRWDDELDGITLASLQAGYARRVQWEGRVFAAAVVMALSEALGAGEGRETGQSGRISRQGGSGRVRRVPADQLLAEMGVRWHDGS